MAEKTEYRADPPEMPDFVPARFGSGYDSAALLLRQVWPVSPKSNCSQVYELFSKDRHLHSLPVVDEDRPLGLINRRIIIEQFSRRYFREIYGRKPIISIMDRAPLIVEKATSLDDLSRMLIEEGEQFLYDGFIITEAGRYLGMGRAHDLMDELSKRKQADLYHAAHHDILTGLPNRQLFRDRLRHAVSRSARQSSLLSVLFIDLDHFKQVNDLYGHAVGDALLVSVAHRIADSVRASDTVARLGGDEFTVILSEISQAEDAARVSEKILDNLSSAQTIQGKTLQVSASIGISLYPQDGEDADALVIHADTALYDAKERRGRFRYFQSSLQASAVQRQEIESEIRPGIQRGEFLLHYQPKVELKTGRISGVEALVRWLHPKRGLLPPSEFIAIAEESGVIVELGEWVMGEALRQLSVWRAGGLPEVSMAVNISARQFEGPGLAELILQLLKGYDLPAKVLELELTETVALSKPEKMAREMGQLRAVGTTIAMDDFGTGYSSLSTLRRFKFDTLKMDQSFVKSLVSSRSDQAICRAVLGLAHDLELRVVAEGVDSLAQLEILREEGCDVIQGYLCSPPLAAADLEQLLLDGGKLPGFKTLAP